MGCIFQWNEAKKKFKMADLKIQNGRLKKNSFSSSANSQYFFMKFSWIGPWVSRIDRCEGHWCDSTNMAMRLSDISSKTGKKMHFWCFRLFWGLCQTASQPYRLSHVMPFASINSTNPRTNLWNFHKKILRIGGVVKWPFFRRPFWFFFFSKKNFFLLFSYEN